ncbi:hypothetical protein HDF26_001224 [Pedobacter cryoconitis]|nr:hypothetical protein [Pedobacter cryoconitis]
MKKMLFTLLVLGSSIYSCLAQNWNNNGKAIYSQVLDSLKIYIQSIRFPSLSLIGLHILISFMFICK